MSSEQERMQILEMIDSGVISAEDGLKLLQALDSQGAAAEGEAFPAAENISIESPDILPPEVPTVPDVPEPPEPSIPPVPPSPPAVPFLPVNAVTHEAAPAPEAEDADHSYSSGSTGTASSGSGETQAPGGRAMPSEVERWKRWWAIPLYIGVAITVIGALLMFLALRASHYSLSFWFACSWIPFLLGIGVIVLAFASSRMRWLHLRVYQKENEWPRKISISMPLPIRLIGWIIKIVGNWVPDLRDKGVDQMVTALEATNSDAPFYLQVDDSDDGERVEIYIG